MGLDRVGFRGSARVGVWRYGGTAGRRDRGGIGVACFSNGISCEGTTPRAVWSRVDRACRHRAGGRSVSEGIVAMRTCRSSTAVIRDFICGLVSPASRPSILAVTR